MDKDSALTTLQRQLDERAAEQADRVAIRRKLGLGTLNVISGPRHSEKTSVLDSIALHWSVASRFMRDRITDEGEASSSDGLKIRYFMHPQAPPRYKDLDRSNRGRSLGHTVKVMVEGNPERLAILGRQGVDVLLVDHVHRYDSVMADVCDDLVTSKGINVHLAGRRLDDRGRPYPVMAMLLCLADSLDFRTAVCSSCGLEGTRDVISRDSLTSTGQDCENENVCRNCLNAKRDNFHPYPKVRPLLSVIAGPSFAGKSEEFRREIRQYLVGRQHKVQLFYPNSLKDRNPGLITAYNRSGVEGVTVSKVSDIFERTRPDTGVVFVDSFEAYDDACAQTAKQIDNFVSNGRTVIATVRDLGPNGRMLRGVGELLCYADVVRKLGATCFICTVPGRATRVHEVPKSWKVRGLVVADEAREYRPICRSCLSQGTEARGRWRVSYEAPTFDFDSGDGE